jgi:hypothetical protein
MRLGVRHPGGPPPLEQADDEGGTDAEGPGDLPESAFVMIDRGDDASRRSVE